MLFSYLIEHNRYLSIFGVGVILAIAWLFSRNKAAINYRLVFSGLALHAFISVLVIKIGFGGTNGVAAAVNALYAFADAGSGFIFGNLIQGDGPWGFLFAFKVLPVIIFFGALMSLLFYVGVIQRIVLAVSYVIRPLLGTSGAETLCAIANSFLGQTEAPLLVRHYLKNMTKSEMLLVMISGMATISGAILVVFVGMGVPAEHLLASSIMAIPASIVISKILLPETEQSKTQAGLDIEMASPASNMFDAISSGTQDGLHLALNVGAMLISFLALLAMLNYFIDGFGVFLGYLAMRLGFVLQIPTLSLGVFFSYICAPFGYLLGFTGHEARAAGQLLGIKVSVNELIAYSQMVSMNLSTRAEDILTYALCGFSNFSCIGIQIGGIGALVPEKRKWLTELGLYAVLGGTLSNLLSAMLASILI